MNSHTIKMLDDRREIAVPGNYEETIRFSAEYFIHLAHHALNSHGYFAVALSGGSTPKAIFNLLCSPLYKDKLDWSKVKIFWSDERSVSPDDPESNYYMAMKAGFSSLPLKEENIFRMPADEEDIEQAAEKYEKLILKNVPNGKFDLVMLGMGDDGHTASLFPKTHGLHVESKRLVIANFIPQKDTWRMTLTFDAIDQAHHSVIYVIGKSKAKMVKEVLTSSYEPDLYPVQRVGTRTHKALWILDNEAASDLTIISA